MDIKHIEGGVCAPAGFAAAGIAAGIKKNGGEDLMMILSEADCSAAAVYTRNKVVGAPITVTRDNISNGRAKGILCNSGNANTCNADGLHIARRCCGIAAEAAELVPSDFIVASTGVIGEQLPLAPFESGIPKLVEALSGEGSDMAARAIMTTDTVKKEFAVEFELDGKQCRMGAIGKGSGMINPNMATMLIFITTDAAIDSGLLQEALTEVTGATLNQICVDGDTSTNDMAAILANGRAGNSRINSKNDDYATFASALMDVLTRMSRALAADGEGATRLIECRVLGAPDITIARRVAKSIVASDLVKAAVHGADANWGRVLCAIGYTAGNFNVDNVSLAVSSAAGEVLVCERSSRKDFDEEYATRILSENEVVFTANLHCGSYGAAAWGCDLTCDYVKINGDYRS